MGQEWISSVLEVGNYYARFKEKGEEKKKKKKKKKKGKIRQNHQINSCISLGVIPKTVCGAVSSLGLLTHVSSVFDSTCFHPKRLDFECSWIAFVLEYELEFMNFLR